MDGFCFICDKTLRDGPTVKVERGIQKLKDVSIDRGDGKIGKFRAKSSIEVHIQCRKRYTRATSVNAFKKKQDEVPVNCSPTGKKSLCFDFKKHCLFCGEQANKETEIKKSKDSRNIIRHVTKVNFKETILKLAEKRQDSLAETMKQRIFPASNLVAVKARYHWKCFLKFNSERKGTKNGRPFDRRVEESMEKIFSYIDNSNDCQFTFTEFMEVLDDFKPDEKTIKKKLEEMYRGRIIFTEGKNGTLIVSFRDTKYDILDEAWYESKKNNHEEERFRVLSAAAAILRQDIRSQVCETENNNPLTTTISDNVNNSIPKSLTFFMEEMTLKNTIGDRDPPKNESIAISHAIMSTVRPRAYLPPLQLGLTLPGKICLIECVFDNVDSNVPMIDGA